MKKIFDLIANMLFKIGGLTNLTYNEVNIIVYYLLVPLSWSIMTDCLIEFPILAPILILVWIYILIQTHSYFKRWCDLGFKCSVDFLLWFKKIGWNYTVASVIICVFIPLMIYALLIYLLIEKF